MINHSSKRVCWLIIVSALLIAGCQQQRKPKWQQQQLAYGPDIEKIVVTNDYTPRAIEAAGGYQLWLKTVQIDLDCVVTFYNHSGSFYLTEQHYRTYPWSNSIRISAVEPQGSFLLQLSEGSFTVLQGAEQVKSLPIAVCRRYLAEAVLNITTAPVRLLDKSFEFTKKPEPVKMEGLWYYPIERREIELYEIMEYWSKVIFYQNKDSSLIDMIWFASAGRKEFLAVRGYDYRELEKDGILVPSKIEIFETDAQGLLQHRLVKIDLK